MPRPDDTDDLCAHEALFADCPDKRCIAVRQSLAAEVVMGDNSAEAWLEDMDDDPLMDGMGQELRELRQQYGR